MIIYLTKFILCSGLFYLAYMLLFEKERMNQFKRFYLLFSLGLSFIIPVIAFESKVEIVPTEALYNFIPIVTAPVPTQSATISAQFKEQPSSFPYLLVGAYIGITLLLLARFIKNMVFLGMKVKSGKKASWQGVTLILNAKESAAYSFMNYIFVSQADYENNKIHEGILQHELAHVKQGHSIDVVLIELLQIFLWFNPLLYFYRKAMQINHEYLADESVIHHHQDVNTYQLVLINYISIQSGLSLTSQFNYLTIKKRLNMMRKTKTLKAVLGRQFLLLPILGIALFLFSTKIEAQETQQVATKERVQGTKKYVHSIGKTQSTKEGVSKEQLNKYKELESKYYSREKASKGKITDEDKKFLESTFIMMSKEQQAGVSIAFIKSPPPLPKIIPTANQLQEFQNKQEYGVWIDGKKVDNDELKNHKPSDFKQVYISKLTGLAKKNAIYNYQVDLMTAAYYEEYLTKTNAKLGANTMVRMFKIAK